MRLIDADALESNGICFTVYGGAKFISLEAEPVKHGKWKKVEGSSGWEQHRCSVCKKEAIFKYEYIDDYDEDLDGEWEYIGQRENGITEYLTDYCPYCGAEMRGECL